MIRSFRAAATVVLAVSLTAVACTTDGHDGDGSRAAALVPLRKLREIQVSGDPLGELGADDPGARTRPVAEVRLGGDRLVAYVDPEAWGLVVDAPRAGHFGLKTAWPKDDDPGTDSLPGGPYAQSSSSGYERRSAWVQLLCGGRAMIVRYEARGAHDVSGVRGAMSVVRSRTRNATLVVIGPKKVRSVIARKLSA
ncbi:hypothetical protein [Streptomyces alboflavus]|uniref:hypothetical protein n=1 Tax=Streptomyces alboflavus TaxID=67267 RepID=UPI001331AD31|nr:hypothetical protein [Streptomyces alboflavus]